MCSTPKMEKDEQYRTNSYNHLIIKKPSNKSRNEPELCDRQQCFGYCNGVDNAKEQQQTAKQTEWVQSKMGATKTNSTFLEFKGNESHMETKYIALCSLHSGSSLFHFSSFDSHDETSILFAIVVARATTISSRAGELSKGLGNDDDGLGSMETHKKYEHKSTAARRNLNLWGNLISILSCAHIRKVSPHKAASTSSYTTMAHCS